jgi:hypothetical protein
MNATEQPTAIPKPDILTVAAISVVVCALASVLHEGLGHGGACLLVGGKPVQLSSMDFNSDTSGLPDWTRRVISAGGTVVNLAAAAIALAAMRRTRSASPHFRYALWLFATVNLFLGTGYFLYSGVAGIGDWVAVTRGLNPIWLWRVVLAVVGGVTYWLAVWLALVKLSPFIGADPVDRVRRANALTLIPYFTGAALSIGAGLLNPHGLLVVAISAAAASLGGMCGLAWGPQLLRDANFIPPSPDGPIPIARSWPWIILAVAIAIPFVAVLGPGIRF